MVRRVVSNKIGPQLLSPHLRISGLQRNVVNYTFEVFFFHPREYQARSSASIPRFPVRSVDMQRATDNITIRQGDTAVISGSGDIHRTRGEAEPAELTNSVRSARCCDRTQSSKSQRR
ncbi:unnamed protein product [Arctogadus glacialis]